VDGFESAQRELAGQSRTFCHAGCRLPQRARQAVCRAINWLGVRLVANDMNAADDRSSCGTANAPHGQVIIIARATIA
jgi:hypothetical protein